MCLKQDCPINLNTNDPCDYSKDNLCDYPFIGSIESPVEENSTEWLIAS